MCNPALPILVSYAFCVASDQCLFLFGPYFTPKTKSFRLSLGGFQFDVRETGHRQMINTWPSVTERTLLS